VFDAVLLESGKAATPELVSAMVEIYRTHKPSINLAQDALEALRELRQIATIAVISDGPITSQSRKAEALELESFADPILLTEIWGSQYRKPHPRAFQELQRHRPAHVYVYVADNPLKDFAAPRQLGWVTVRVRRPGGLYYAVENGEVTPDWEMPDCSGLPGVLARL